MGTNQEKRTDFPPQEGQPLMGGYGQPQGQGVYYPPPGHPPGPPQTIPYPPGPTLTTQPMPGGAPNSNWMAAPQGVVPNCPPGLEYLTMIDQLVVKQKVELLEAFTGFETKNKYLVSNSLGQKVFFAGEESDCCTRNCCGSSRPFDMKVIDNFSNEVIHFHRPLACQACCFPCCLQSMEVSSPPGTIIGIIEQQWHLCSAPIYTVKNPAGDVVLRIEGPCWTCSCCPEVDFKILSPDGSNEVGKISKKWSGFGKEILTDATNFGVSFPVDLDVRMKATLLGACFLIDMMYFEDDGDD